MPSSRKPQPPRGVRVVSSHEEVRTVPPIEQIAGELAYRAARAGWVRYHPSLQRLPALRPDDPDPAPGTELWAGLERWGERYFVVAGESSPRS